MFLPVLNGKLLPKNIARVSQYFLNETKDQLMDAYNKRFALSFRKREYEIILNTEITHKKCYNTIRIFSSKHQE